MIKNLALSVMWLASHRAFADTPSDHAARRARVTSLFSKPCQELSLQDWQDILEAESSSYVLMHEKEFLKLIRKCEGRVKTGKDLACLVRLKGFAERYDGWEYSRAGDHSLRFVSSDKTYLASVPKKAVALPEELLSGVSAAALADARTDAKNGVAYISTLNETYRILFMREDPKYVKFFIPVTPASSFDFRQPHVCGVIAIDKETRPHKIHFFEYSYRDGRYSFEGMSASCIRCHHGGLVKIEPEMASVGSNQLAAIDKINARMETLNKEGIDWQGELEVQPWGPPLGKAQGCTSCHDNSQRTPITMLSSSDLINQKLAVTLSMPPSPEADEFARVMRLVPQLPESERKKIMRTKKELYELLTLSEGEQPKLPRHMAALQSLKEAKLLTSQQHEEFTKKFKELGIKQSTIAKSRFQEDEKAIRAWLREIPCVK